MNLPAGEVLHELAMHELRGQNTHEAHAIDLARAAERFELSQQLCHFAHIKQTRPPQ
jgi:hypothetical protein